MLKRFRSAWWKREWEGFVEPTEGRQPDRLGESRAELVLGEHVHANPLPSPGPRPREVADGHLLLLLRLRGYLDAPRSRAESSYFRSPLEGPSELRRAHAL